MIDPMTKRGLYPRPSEGVCGKRTKPDPSLNKRNVLTDLYDTHVKKRGMMHVGTLPSVLQRNVIIHEGVRNETFRGKYIPAKVSAEDRDVVSLQGIAAKDSPLNLGKRTQGLPLPKSPRRNQSIRTFDASPLTPKVSVEGIRTFPNSENAGVCFSPENSSPRNPINGDGLGNAFSKVAGIKTFPQVSKIAKIPFRRPQTSRNPITGDGVVAAIDRIGKRVSIDERPKTVINPIVKIKRIGCSLRNPITGEGIEQGISKGGLKTFCSPVAPMAPSTFRDRRPFPVC